jgi:hypothetical protein
LSAQIDDTRNSDEYPLNAFAYQPESDQSLIVMSNNHKDIFVSLPLSEPIFIIISEKKGKWFKIEAIHTLFKEYSVPENGLWIQTGNLKTAFKQAGLDSIMIYKNAEKNSPLLDEFTGYRDAEIIKVKSNFVKIRYQNPDGTLICGWVLRSQLCANPLTTCP